ncbi:hypothetical protein SCLCIDRAFT_635928 [Scleroderma citrinum Foug A]|uniref:Ribosomal protein S14 n=1 Tax=Scleroderma citrinum Foug A TaxID=1036808 RepID=A0A0C3CSA5_9AGAM|nr:hypothetical protein SCLCIDRAFT_635928 [Scleroderma citrinum Foug A]
MMSAHLFFATRLRFFVLANYSCSHRMSRQVGRGRRWLKVSLSAAANRNILSGSGYQRPFLRARKRAYSGCAWRRLYFAAGGTAVNVHRRSCFAPDRCAPDVSRAASSRRRLYIEWGRICHIQGCQQYLRTRRGCGGTRARLESLGLVDIQWTGRGPLGGRKKV